MKMAVALQSSNSNSFSGGGITNNGHHLGGKNRQIDLEMIYEVDDMIDDSSGRGSLARGGISALSNGQSDQGGGDLIDPDPASPPDGDRAMLMMKRSRSLPQEEFPVYLSQKLKELELFRRTDSVISGQSARSCTGRDSGFNSEIPSCECGIGSRGILPGFPVNSGIGYPVNSGIGFPVNSGIGFPINSGIVFPEQASQNDLDFPSALLVSDLNSGILAQYGLNGPLDEYPGEEDEGDADDLEVGGADDLLGMPPMPSAVTSVTTKRKRKEEMKQATIRQHYYPEGGWGFVVVIVAIIVQIITHGLQLSFGILILAIKRRWPDAGYVQITSLGSLCMAIGLIMSPLTVGVCKRKSTRLTGVIGGLVLALGCLFSSFANQFHQLFFSHAIMTGIGVGLTRDTATIMVAQYFKRRREFVEIFVVAASGLGITLMSSFICTATNSVGWRLGLQQITGLLITTFLLGTFYRSASLYHPQRRAILHLKTQKRKIKNKDKEKNKLQDDRPPFFEFTALKSRTVQIILLSTFLSHVGIFSPLFFLANQASDAEEKITKESVVQLQTFMGVAWFLGTLFFGLVLACQSAECRIARQYLTQASLVLTGLSIFALTAVKGSYSGYVMFCWIYGVCNGGYAYTLKMYIYEKVRARNFARAWSFTQMAMGLALVIGLPLSSVITQTLDPQSNVGYYFSATCVVLGGICLSFVDMHKKRLRKKRRLRQCKSTASTATTGTTGTTFNSTTGTIHRHLYSSHSQSIDTPGVSMGPKMGYQMVVNECPSSPSPGLPIIMPAAVVAANNSREEAAMAASVSEVGGIVSEGGGVDGEDQQPLQLFLVRSNSAADTPDTAGLASAASTGAKKATLQKLMSFDMMEPGYPMDEEMMLEDEEEDEDLVFNEDYLEGITSCNKVENCVILSEFEQNQDLMKDSGEFGVSAQGQRRLRDPHTKKWFPVKRGKNHPEALANRGKKWNQVLPGPSKEMATVIEEQTSTV